MSVEIFTIFTLLGSLAAGFLGALTGLGGGVVIIPLLTLGLGVDLHYAIGASLVSVIATSSGSAAAYVKEGITNMRIGMFLEVATTLGAVLGAFLSGLISPNIIAIIFAVLLLYSALNSIQAKVNHEENNPNDKWAKKFKLNSSYPAADGIHAYSVRNVPGGFFMMAFAGVMSGLLGIGSGALKVLAMDKIMRIPFKVSTTTSNFMIGVTAAASAVVYFQKGYIEPSIAAPVLIGVLLGAMTGARLLIHIKTQKLRWIFAIVVTFLAGQMIWKAINGGF
jgi:uncharacterized membrane protein YfcA